MPYTLLPHITHQTSPISVADLLGLKYDATVDKKHKKDSGQFFTSIEIATFMASQSTVPISRNIQILDPGCGIGILACALIEKISEHNPISITLTAYETDEMVLPYFHKTAQHLTNWLRLRNINFQYTLHNQDFIEDTFDTRINDNVKFDYIISNPPYFKLPKDDNRVKLVNHLAKGQPNIYSLFMIVSVNLLKPTGEMIFIVPRSFASGQYFNSFRDYFFRHISLNFVHLFKSRSDTFNRDSVLQELLILKGSKVFTHKLVISTSEGVKDLPNPQLKNFKIEEVIDLSSKAKILHLPTQMFEEKVMKTFKSWENYLADFGINISTGRVVSFRTKEHLHDINSPNTNCLSPLIWLHNVNKMNIDWPKPLPNKSQYINVNDSSKKLLVPNKNYVLLRRFSSKDDKSRLIAAPFISNDNNRDFIGIENKVNYIHKPSGELDSNEAIGISALLNSLIFDTYFRTFNGNVNVSATEIRLMPFPPLEVIISIGNELIDSKNWSQENINRIVNYQLKFN